MSNITYENISIVGITYSRLVNIEIKKKILTHAEAIITCEVTAEEANKMLSGMNDEEKVTVAATSSGEYEVLFIGVKYNLEITEGGEYRTAKLVLKSTSYLLDMERKSRTFQNKTLTYSAVMNKIADGRAIIKFNATDRKIIFKMQKDITDWQMIVRLASDLNTKVSVNVTTETPIITVGMPEANNKYDLGALDTNAAQEAYVCETNSQLLSGMFETTCITASADEFKQEKMSNEEAAGNIFTGIVQEVDKEKVKVFFDQIDSEYDAEGDSWFEYSTSYASGGGAYGSGFYFMPEVGDRVRVFFPSGDESEGFAFASESNYALDSPDKISWRAPGGQELLFTPDGIRIIGKEDCIYIDMSDNEDAEVGIQVFCDKKINVSVHPSENIPEPQIYLHGAEGVVMYAENQIMFDTPEAKVELDKDRIILNANNVYIK